VIVNQPATYAYHKENKQSKIPLICHMTIWHLRTVVPRPEVLLFARKKKKASMKQADLMNMFTKASKCVCTSTVEVLFHPLSPTPSASSVMKTSENIEEDPDDPKPADEGDIHMEYSSD
jgi:hypothetical protein